jgi:hypothetical protein
MVRNIVRTSNILTPPTIIVYILGYAPWFILKELSGTAK